MWLVAVAAAAVGVLWALWALVVSPWRTQRFYAQQGATVAPHWPVVGALPWLVRWRARPLDERVRHMHRSALSFWSPGVGHRVMFATVESAKDLLVASNDCMEKPAILRTLAQDMLGRGLLLSEGALHARQRAAVAPAFHFSNLKRVMPAMCAVMAQAAREWLAEALAAPHQRFLAHERMSGVTLAVLGSAVFGGNLARGRHGLFQALAAALSIDDVFSFKMLIPGYSLLPFGGRRAAKRLREDLSVVVWQLIAELKAAQAAAAAPSDEGVTTLLELMVGARDADGNPMPNDLIRDEAMVFILAGHETTATLMSWTMLMLCQHPEWRDRARAEVDAVLGKRMPAFEDLSQLKVVSAVLNETLRRYPSLPMVARNVVKPCTVDGVQLLPGTLALMSIVKLHHNEKYWSDPFTFNPERFLGDHSHHPMAFLPFSAGRRDCIGRNFAMMEARIILSMMLQHMEFDLSPDYVHHPYQSMTLRPLFDIPMIIRPREASGAGQ